MVIISTVYLGVITCLLPTTPGHEDNGEWR